MLLIMLPCAVGVALWCAGALSTRGGLRVFVTSHGRSHVKSVLEGLGLATVRRQWHVLVPHPALASYLGATKR